jgi:hypothetical protein
MGTRSTVVPGGVSGCDPVPEGGSEIDDVSPVVDGVAATGVGGSAVGGAGVPWWTVPGFVIGR